MLYLRFLAQNNEITPYRVIASAIEKGKYRPKEFDLMSRYMNLIIVRARREAEA